MSEARGPRRPTEHGTNIGHTSAWMAHRKVALDLHRILNEDDPDRAIVDAPYTVMALRHVLRGIEMTRTHLKTGAAQELLSEALAEFDRAVSGGKKARDVIEHFDEYAMGTVFRRSQCGWGVMRRRCGSGCTGSTPLAWAGWVTDPGAECRRRITETTTPIRCPGTGHRETPA